MLNLFSNLSSARNTRAVVTVVFATIAALASIGTLTGCGSANDFASVPVENTTVTRGIPLENDGIVRSPSPSPTPMATPSTP